MAHRTRAFCTLTAMVALAALSMSSGSIVNAQRETEEKKPSVSLKATPPVGFSPLRVRVTVDLRGLNKASREWSLVCTAHNLLKLAKYGG